MSSLTFAERPAAGSADGLLILHHGRGTDERDLLPLADALDSQQRLHVVTPRAPLQLEASPGYHWYVAARVGHPDPPTFHASFRKLATFHDHLFERTEIPPEKAVLGGFSMGAVMSYALGLSADRPHPAGILALSGFVPTVEGWNPDPESRQALPVFIAHGRQDPVIEVSFGRRARELLASLELDVTYLEYNAPHAVVPDEVRAVAGWLATVTRPCETP